MWHRAMMFMSITGMACIVILWAFSLVGMSYGRRSAGAHIKMYTVNGVLDFEIITDPGALNYNPNPSLPPQASPPLPWSNWSWGITKNFPVEYKR